MRTGLVLLLAILCSSCRRLPDSVLISVPDSYRGSFVIREDKTNGRQPDGAALENYSDWYWEFSKIDEIVYVADIRPFMHATNISAAWASVSGYVQLFSWERDEKKQQIKCKIETEPAVGGDSVKAADGLP